MGWRVVTITLSLGVRCLWRWKQKMWDFLATQSLLGLWITGGRVSRGTNPSYWGKSSDSSSSNTAAMEMEVEMEMRGEEVEVGGVLRGVMVTR